LCKMMNFSFGACKYTMNEIIATYHIETAYPLDVAAAVMAGEQSSGTFVKVPGETAELMEKHAAKVLSMTPLQTVDTPSLPGSRPPKGHTDYQQAEVVISYPFANVGASLTTLITTVSGNLYELGQFSGLKLMDVTIPTPFADVYPGPQFGIEGTRRLSGVKDRPLIGTIIKPSVGFSPEQTADLVKTLCEADIDFIKDDELQTNSPHSPLKERVAAVMRVINDHAERTGKKVMFAFNITGDIEDMLRGHDVVLEHGGTCVMINMLATGLSAVAYLRKHSQLPIHGHRAGWGAMTRHPLLGMSYIAYQKFARLAGVDHLHVNGLRNKFTESDESVIASARACLTPMLGGYTVMPVFSSGQSANQVQETFAQVGTDLMYLAGGGIIAHPSGPGAGVQSLREAWDGAMAGISLTDYAATHPALREALEAFNPR
jgi:ribulose-bisphosphate carboxylase large chain